MGSVLVTSFQAPFPSGCVSVPSQDFSCLFSGTSGLVLGRVEKVLQPIIKRFTGIVASDKSSN